MELDDVNKYVRALVGLASMAVILRVLWVVDVILQVQKVVKESQEDGDGDGKGKDDPSAGMDDPTTAGQPMDDRTVVSFGIQVSSIGVHCSCSSSCCCYCYCNRLEYISMMFKLYILCMWIYVTSICYDHCRCCYRHA